MAEQERPRRTPGGFVPPKLARPQPPATNGHSPQPRPLNLRRSAWSDVDEEDERVLAAERVTFQRVADVDPNVQVRASGRPTRAALVGVLVILGLVVLAVVLYRFAPP
jgi:hypothetical protein